MKIGNWNVIKYPMVDINNIPHGQFYLCLIRHYDTKNLKISILKKVKEDDCNFRFKDNAPLAYEWDVAYWQPIPKELMRIINEVELLD